MKMQIMNRQYASLYSIPLKNSESLIWVDIFSASRVLFTCLVGRHGVQVEHIQSAHADHFLLTYLHTYLLTYLVGGHVVCRWSVSSQPMLPRSLSCGCRWTACELLIMNWQLYSRNCMYAGWLHIYVTVAKSLISVQHYVCCFFLLVVNHCCTSDRFLGPHSRNFLGRSLEDFFS